MSEQEIKLVEEPTQETSILEDIFNSFSEASPELGGFDEIAALIALPDEHFDVLSEIVLAEMEKAVNNPNDRLLFEAAYRSAGREVENLEELYENMIDEIDISLADQIGQKKADFLKRMLGIIMNAFTSESAETVIIEIPYEICKEGGKEPSYANVGDAGMDIYSTEEYVVAPGETVLVSTGIKVAIPAGYELQVRPKSGISLKTKLRVANTPGTIDSGYRDEIGVIVENVESPIQDIDYTLEDGKLIINSILHGKTYTIEKGQKIAQLVLCKVPKAGMFQVEKISEVEGNRGGGFGSTGLQ